MGITPALVAKILASCFVSFKPMGPKLGPAGKIDWLSMQMLGLVGMGSGTSPL